jgi:hypothetical protein
VHPLAAALVAAAAACAAPLACAAAPPRVDAPAALAAEARAVAAAVERALPGLEAFFGEPLPRDVRIVLAPTPAAFVDATGGGLPAWAIGVAIAGEARIVVLGERVAPAGTRTGPVAVHEVAHLFVDALGGPDVPRWLDEGIAVSLSGEDRGASFWDLARALVADGSLSLDEIAHRFPSREATARLAYYESLTAVQFIARTWGAASIPDLLRATRVYGFGEALRDLYGMSPDDFEEAWDRDLRRRTRWVVWTADGLPFAAAVTLLFAAAVVRSRVRARRQLARWAADEARAAEAAPEDPADRPSGGP